MSDHKIKLGSLFSGIGGFELVGSWYDFEPVWASEIEPAPMRITKLHFPNMKHVGDITKLDGGKLAPVDIITGGSPCQDMSVAGKQSGISMICTECGETIDVKSEIKTCPKCGSELELTRSGLFMEQIRVIKEMRNATNGKYPKIVVWENVSGALSSNNGQDFQCVLSEFCGLLSQKLPAARPEKWSKSGELLADNGSIAWRTLDAQYWGVPQRRRRIFLVVDFRGQCAGEILFKPESMRRHHTTVKTPWETASEKIGRCVEPTNKTNEPTKGKLTVYGICSYTSNSMKSSNPPAGIYETDLVKTLDTSGTNPACNQGGNIIVEDNPVYCLQGNGIDRADTAGCNGKGWKENQCYTLNTMDRPAVAYSTHDRPYVAAFKYQQAGAMATLPYDEDKSSTLTSKQNMAVLIDNHGQDCRWTLAKNNVCQALTSSMGNGGNNQPFIIQQHDVYAQSAYGSYAESYEVCATLTAHGAGVGPGAESLVSNQLENHNSEYIIRRLTPLECERLQGFPDNWTTSESDFARYKALGNSVALPCVNYIMSGIADVLSD